MTPALRRKFYESIGELFANAMMHSGFSRCRFQGRFPGLG